MTLLLTYMTHQYVVQASDRRLTLLDGTIKEELANKATLWGNFAFSECGDQLVSFLCTVAQED